MQHLFRISPLFLELIHTEGARATIMARFGTDIVMGKMAELYRELEQARRN
jgi:hypothetical protein